MEIKKFYDLTAWKRAHELVLDIYKITKIFPSEEQFGVTSQLRRASSSITANIAEGFGRYHFKDKIKFYYQARGSATEVQDFINKRFRIYNLGRVQDFGRKVKRNYKTN